MRTFRIAALLTALMLVGAACGGDDSGGAGGRAGGRDGDLASQCPIGTLAKRSAGSQPVTITYWHSMTQQNQLDLLKQFAAEFHDAHPDVRVRLVSQTGYTDTLTKFRAAMAGGGLPDLVQLEDTATQQMIDSQRVVPAQACVDAEHYDLSDHLQRVVDFYTVEDVLWPMPFNVSNPVLYYSRGAFRAAGLDPDQPPKTLEEVKADSQKIVDAGATPHGFALVEKAWFPEMWLAMANDPFVDNGNGRDGRATKVLFDNATGRTVFRWIHDMVRSGLAEDVGPEEGNINHYLAVAKKASAMTVDTSAAIGTILAFRASGQYTDIDFGVAPFPGLPGDGGTFVAGGTNYIVKGSDPAKVEAAWLFAKYLNTPDVQARWAATGYIPIRKSSVDRPALKQLWQEHPEYKVAYDQLDSDVQTVATSGPVIGDYRGVRKAITDGMEAMLQGGKAPDTALRDAAREADRIIADYNSRVG
jgi:sn-glycerol 3-phosphate transport system substrate-binding protein